MRIGGKGESRFIGTIWQPHFRDELVEASLWPYDQQPA